MNPGYSCDEFEFYLEDLGAQLLVVQEGVETPAIAAAQKCGIDIAELSFAETDPAGVFTLMGKSSATPVAADQGGFASGDDIALVLHTSGTTSRPKLVPLSQQNICASAGHISTSLELSEKDRCLNIMPLFHIHGLIAAVLASLDVGASIVCTPGFNALKFFTFLSRFPSN